MIKGVIKGNAGRRRMADDTKKRQQGRARFQRWYLSSKVKQKLAKEALESSPEIPRSVPA